MARQNGIGLFEVVKSDPDFSELLREGNLEVESYFESIREVSRKVVAEAISKHKKNLPR